jgi:Ca2+-binding RTX toxin-like protein
MRRILLIALAVAAVAAGFGIAAHPASAAYTARVQSGTLKITGDNASDKLGLFADATTLTLDVGEDGTTDFTFDRSTFTAVDVQAGGGDDEVRITGSLAGDTVSINGGAGDDTLLGGPEVDTLNGAGGSDFIDGNQGNDTALLGAGNDTFQWDPGDGSDTVEGQGGHDTMAFNGSNAGEKIELSANGDRLRLTRDIANITMDAAGIDTVDVRTLGSADTVTVNDLTGTDVKTVGVDLAGFDGQGDGAADSVIVNGTADADKVTLGNVDANVAVNGLSAKTLVTGGEPALDAIHVDTLGGDDTITGGVGVAGSIPVIAEGGDGTDTAQYNGTPGNDAIGIASNGTSALAFSDGSVPLGAAPGTENLVVSGLDGDDTITGQNGIATFTSLTIDGGQGNDTLAGGDGNDTLLGGPGNDLVDGNRGNDVAFLGTGDDTFQWDPGDGSDTVEGQGGHDTMQFNGSNAGEKIELSANGDRLRLSRDVGNITMDTDGIDTVDVRALGSADTVTVDDLSGTNVKTVNVDLSAVGGGGDGAADTVVVNGTDKRDVVNVTQSGGVVSVAGLAATTTITGSEPALDTLRVQTLAGNDDVTVAPDVATVIATVVDLGTDE